MDNILLPAPRLMYKDLLVSEYLEIFNQPNLKSFLKGGALTDISLFKNNKYSNLFKKEPISGAGFWSILNNLARKSVPILKYILPEALNLGSSIIEKAKSNPDKLIKKDDLKTLAKTSVKNLAKKTLSSLGGKHRQSSYKPRRHRKTHKLVLKRNKFRLHKVKKVKRLKSKNSKVKRPVKLKKHTIFGNI